MEHWYDVNLKYSGFLADKDYQNYVLFNLFRYVNTIDITMVNSPYNIVSALFGSQEHAELFCRESGNFVQNIKHSVDRKMLTERIYLTKKIPGQFIV